MFNFRKIYKRLVLTSLLLIGSLPSAQAAPITFLVDWSGAGFANSIEAHGSVTFESTTLPNPGFTGIIGIPNSILLDLSITVTNSGASDGTFGLSDYAAFIWDSGNLGLDLTTELVGQPTSLLPWGTPGGGSGDLNFFASSGGAPTAFSPFIMSAGGNQIALTSMRPASPTSVPEPAGMLLLGSGLIGMIGLRRRRVRS